MAEPESELGADNPDIDFDELLAGDVCQPIAPDPTEAANDENTVTTTFTVGS